MYTIKKGFTLIELTITMIILSLLIGILFQTFIVISHIAVKIQNERMLHAEVVYITQTIQNLVDRGDISLNSKKSGETVPGYIEKILHLISNEETEYTLQLSGEVLVLEEEIKGSDGTATKNNYKLTDTTKLIVKNMYIKAFPGNDNLSSIENKSHDAFWLFLDLETPHYNKDKRRFRVKRKMQTFFNIRKYD